MANTCAVVLLLLQMQLVFGQSYPSCADACITAATPASCNSSDYTCICPQIQSASILACLASSCNCADQQTAATTLNAVCSSDGVQLALNVACAASSSSSASSTDSLPTSSTPSSTLTSTTPVSALPSSSPPATTQLAAPSSAAQTLTSSTLPAAPTSSILNSGSSIAVVSSGSGAIQTSTAIVVFTSGTITDLITSTHYYTPTPSTTPASNTGSSQGELINHGLSVGAKAGIGAGVAGGGLIAIILAAWLFWFCRRRKRRSSISASDRYPPSTLPGVLPARTVSEKRISELHSEPASRKQAFSWESSSAADSGRHAPISDAGDSSAYQPISEEGSYHHPTVDAVTYQRPVLGHDGYWHNAQELQGAAPPNIAGGSYSDRRNETPAQRIQKRTIVPPGKWPPHF